MFLKSSYKTRGKTARQRELFPELCAEIDAETVRRADATKWGDQNASEYKDHCCERAAPLIGKSLTPAQCKRFLHQVIRMYSVCFWVEGCAAPKVEDFIAHLRLLFLA